MGDVWEGKVKEMLASGNLREAKRLADELWGFEGMVLKIHRFNQELMKERQRNETEMIVAAALNRHGRADLNDAGLPVSEGTKLVGWQAILGALGFEPKNRRHRRMIKEWNERTSGPIRSLGRRVVVFQSELGRWWRRVVTEAEEIDRKLRESDQQAAVVVNALQNPGVRKEEGFHLKDTPNKRRRTRE